MAGRLKESLKRLFDGNKCIECGNPASQKCKDCELPLCPIHYESGKGKCSVCKISWEKFDKE